MNDNQHMKEGDAGQWPKGMPFRLPHDFFNLHRAGIMEEIRRLNGGNTPEKVVSELKTLSPLLAEAKQKGVAGKWDNRRADDILLVYSEDITISGPQAPVLPLNKPNSVNKISWWKIAAVTTGIIFMATYFWNRQELRMQYADIQDAATEKMTDSIGFSDEELTLFINESGHPYINISTAQSDENSLEINVNSNEMLLEPQLFDQQMETIPVAELEAFANELYPAS